MTKEETFDVAIVGYGPAGITAALYITRKKLKVALIGEIPGGEIVNSGEIENWPGSGRTNGIDLAQAMIDHLKLHQDYIRIFQKRVESISKNKTEFTTKLTDQTEIRSRTVIYAAGRHPRQLEIPGEIEFKNKGVSYCATCDAPLFPNKTVAVIGGGNTGAEAVIMFQAIAKKIYLLHLGSALAADTILTDSFKNDPKVKIILNAKTTSIYGQTTVEKLTFEDTKNGHERTLKVDGVFVNIGATPNTVPIKDLVKLDRYGAIITDRYGQTSLPGFFAAGDVTDIRDAQIVVAAGHGCSAALSAGLFLAKSNS